jgi:titin
VLGDFIVTDNNGTSSLANSVGVEDASGGNILGGTTSAARNVLSGNKKDGVVLDSSASSDQVQGNFIGTNANGTSALSNSIGVEISGLNSLIGGTSAGARNVISGNSQDGVLIHTSASGTQVQGNYIGTNAAGASALADGIGVVLDGSNNTLGGTASGARNVVSGNTTDGVYVGATGVSVQGNYVGLNAAGTGALGNTTNGIEVAASSNVLGGTAAAARNVISGNATGIHIDSSVSGVAVLGNYIGTDHSGTSAVANGTGIVVQGSSNTIGGTVAGSRNVISGNTGSGVSLVSSVTGIAVQGNYIGVNAAASALGNAGYGVSIAGSKNTIGGSIGGAGNTIAFNSQGGIHVSAGSGDTLRHNLIYANGPSNTGPGIVLAAGTNNNLAAPSLSSATYVGTTLTVTGTFNAPTANVSYVLEFFASPTGDPEGKIYVGSRTVTPTTTGAQPFTFTVTTTAPATDPLITATLTDASGDTSKFSNGILS